MGKCVGCEALVVEEFYEYDSMNEKKHGWISSPIIIPDFWSKTLLHLAFPPPSVFSSVITTRGSGEFCVSWKEDLKGSGCRIARAGDSERELVWDCGRRIAVA